MSKIMKRTLTLVLTVCMLLSVVAIATPVAKAANDVTTFSFAHTTTADPRTVKPYTSLSAIAAGDWAFISGGANEATSGYYVQVGNDGITSNFRSWYGGYSTAVVINVPEAGYYDLVTACRNKVGGPNGGLRIGIKYIGDDATLVDELVSKDGKVDTQSVINQVFGVEGTIETKVRNYMGRADQGGTPAIFYAGNHELKAGNYLVLMTAWDFAFNTANYTYSGGTGSDCRTSLRYIKLVKSMPGVGAGLNEAFLLAWNGGNGGIVNLMNPLTINGDYELTRSTATPDGQPAGTYISTLNLNGQTATFKSFAVTDANCYVTDTVGGGKIVTTGGYAPTFVAGQDQVAVKTAENTFTMFAAPKTTVKAGPVATDGTDADYATGSDARFVFKATLDAEALAAIAAGTQEVTIGATWKQGDKDLATTIFENEDVITWATGDNSTAKVFYIDVKGMDRLTSGETVTCTPYITIGSVTKTLAPITYTAA